ncbi:MAG: hypothetical protein JXC85_03310 [Candidatus Aenigmarchaeota archaeon]|nr:hypothetical protein [Candidatus Aenigmarchaeota archaeon]
MMKSKDAKGIGSGIRALTILLALIISISMSAGNAAAATYFSMKPDNELCTTILFGQNGRGEYTLYAQEPPAGGEWIDNHFTSFVAGPENLVVVPLCFSAKGRKLGDQANIHVTVDTPEGNVSYDYGICVGKYDDVDVLDGSAGGNACDAMAGHTDIFSASFVQPDQYADPGEAVSFMLLLDSSLPLTLEIAKGTQEMSIVASKSSVAAGGGQQEVELKVVAPGTVGDYDFIVVVSAQGCEISDCQRAVRGVLHVRQASDAPQSGFFAWLTPETKSIMGQQTTMYVLKFQNYGEGQELSASVALEYGLESDFSPYSVFLAKGESRSITFTVRPTTADINTYKLTAVVTGADGGKRSADAWLTVDEMVADADKLDQDGFIADYEASGGASLEDWEELRSVTGAVPGSDGRTPGATTAPAETNYVLWIVTAVVIVIIAVLILFIYKRMSVEGEGGWESLGI